MSLNESSPVRRVVGRISRYSSLRCAERALLPSVRRRCELPSRLFGREVMPQLQELLGSAGKRGRAAPLPLFAEELAGIDERLGRFAHALRALALRTPMSQLRTTLPSTTREHASETSALLDLCLQGLGRGTASYGVRGVRPRILLAEVGEAPFLIDYSITLLASLSNSPQASASGVRVLRVDPCTVSPGVEARCAAADERSDDRASQFASGFRSASLEVLSLDDLEPLILRVRETKARLGACLFDREVLTSVVCYNLAVSNRLLGLREEAREPDVDVERTLVALRALDIAEVSLPAELVAV